MAGAAACGEDGPITDPHELGDCDKSWNNEVGKCEIACKKEPVQLGAGCPAKLREDIPNGFTDCTNGTFEIDGFIGCCIKSKPPNFEYPGYENTALFAECQ